MSEVLCRARRRARIRASALTTAATVAVVVLALAASSLRDDATQVAPPATKPPGPQQTSDVPPTVGPAPNVVGLAVDAAVGALTQADCPGRIGAIVNDSTARVGQVLAQRTTSDICEVDLTVSAGPASSAPPCTSLEVNTGSLGAAAGHSGFALRFRNSGSVACALVGFPTVTATDSRTGQTISARHTPGGYLGGTDLPVPTLVLRPGDQVSALVEAENNPHGDATSCTELIHMRVSVNGRTTSMTQTLANCAGMEVHLFVPGTTGTAR